MSRQAFTVGDTLGRNVPKYFLRHAISGHSLSSHYARVQQRIESVQSYAGQTITILGYAKRSSGTGNMAVEVFQNFGTGGSPSAEVTGTGQTVTLTGSWAAFAITVSVPSITGKTLGSNNNDYLGLNIWTSAGSDFNSRTNSLGLQTINVDLYGIHIRVGTHTASAADSYVAPPLSDEFTRCQRYYEEINSCPACINSATVALGVSQWAVVKRGTPSISLATAGNIASAGFFGSPSAIANTNMTSAYGYWDFTISGATAGQGSVWRQGVIKVDAEL
jgi:hypothetical protein